MIDCEIFLEDLGQQFLSLIYLKQLSSFGIQSIINLSDLSISVLLSTKRSFFFADDS